MKLKRFFLLVVFSAFILNVHAKTKNFGTWIELDFSEKFMKKFELSFSPEIRLQDNFTVDEYMFDGKFSYKPVKFFEIAAIYRVNIDVKESGNETLGRFAFDATFKKDFGRIESSLRTRYTNYFELDNDDPDKKYLRPRFKFEYDVKGNKIKPFVSYELFRNLADKEFDKSRFDVGASRKVGKNSKVGVYYRLQNYFSDKNSIHILGLEYGIKF